MARKVSPPAFTLHKPTGQARVRIAGKDIYLGPFDSPKARQAYDKILFEWNLDHEETDSFTITIDSLALHYLRFVDSHYLKNGVPTSEPAVIRIALKFLMADFGTELARKFGPKSLKIVREKMITGGIVRSSCNRMMGRIKRMFRWGVAEELVSSQTLAALESVTGLQRGRTTATESAPILPVDRSDVEAIRPFVSRQVMAMIDLQLLTAGRPGEFLTMRGCDLVTEAEVWEYRPESHKTEHHGRDRVIFLATAAQEIVKQYLKSDPKAYLFSPIEAKAEFQAARRANRKTPITPSQKNRIPKSKPAKCPGDHYTICSYGQAIRKACLKAKISPWHPNQLRHTKATEIRKRFGLEATQTILGHAKADVTQIYAERDTSRARAIIAEMG